MEQQLRDEAASVVAGVDAGPLPKGAAFLRLLHTTFGTVANATFDCYTSDYNMAVI